MSPSLSRQYLLCVFYCYRSHLVLPNLRPDHVTHLEGRLLLWHKGKLEHLVVEDRAIQSRLPKVSTSISDAQVTRTFANFMFEGKTRVAIKLLTRYKHGGLLQLHAQVDSTSPSCLVHDVLKEKHPPA